MANQATRRLLRGVAAMILAAVLSTAFSVGWALAGSAPARAAGPDAISVTGSSLPQAVLVRADERPEQFTALFDEVSWLASRPGQTRAPDTGLLGPGYTVTVLTRGKPTQRYELYPLATGGPRAYRPAGQPDRRRVDAAWFYGRLSMPDTLRAVGIPMSGAEPANTGGTGGGEVAHDEFDPNADLTTLLGEWRHFLLLNGAVVGVITLGLAGIALFVRYRYDRPRRRG